MRVAGVANDRARDPRPQGWAARPAEAGGYARRVTASASVRAHAAVPFMNPMAEADVDSAIAALPLSGRAATVLETGCGGAELLLRVLEAHPGARGVGVDPDPRRAGTGAGGRGGAAGARAPAGAAQARAQDADLTAGGSTSWSTSRPHTPTVASRRRSASSRRSRVPVGGLVLLGEGYWTRPPADAVPAGARRRDRRRAPAGVDALRAAARAAGLEILDVREASTADWAAYEEGLAAEAERHDDEEARAYARRIRERRALPGGDATMGFALLTLRRR